MTEEETSCSMSRMKEICSCFSPYTSCHPTPPLPPPCPAGSAISPLIIQLPSHPQVLLTPSAPHCNLQPALKVYSISLGAALPTFAGLSKELGLLWLLLQWGTPAMTLQAPSWRKLVGLSLPVCQVCLKLAELSRVDRWMDNDS